MEKYPWKVFQKAQAENRLCDLIKTIPRDQWCESHGSDGTWSLLHVTCQLREYEATVYLLKNGHPVDVKWRDEPLLCYAAFKSTPKIFKLLLASGCRISHRHTANLLLPSHSQFSTILIENGYRLGYLFPLVDKPQSLPQLERGVEICRNVIVMILALKKKRRILPKIDRFLIQQVLAVEIWATRTCVEWRNL